VVSSWRWLSIDRDGWIGRVNETKRVGRLELTVVWADNSRPSNPIGGQAKGQPPDIVLRKQQFVFAT